MTDLACFLPSLEAGGAERVNLNLINQFADNGYAVDLLIWRRGGEFEEELHPNITVYDVDPIRVPGYNVSGIIPPLRRYLNSKSPRVLLSSMNHVNVPVAIAHKLSGANTKLVLS